MTQGYDDPNGPARVTGSQWIYQPLYPAYPQATHTMETAATVEPPTLENLARRILTLEQRFSRLGEQLRRVELGTERAVELMAELRASLEASA